MEGENWLEGATFEEGYTPSERVQQFGDLGKLAKGYDSAMEKIQSKGILVPGEDASDDERAEFNSTLKSHLGIAPPESADAYTWKPPEGMENYFDSMADDLKRYHEAGYDDKTVSGLMTEKAEGIKAAQTLMQNQQAEIAKQSEEALKEKWGSDYEENLSAVSKISERYPDLQNVLKTAGLANNQAVIEALHDVAMSVKEDAPPKGGTGDPKTLESRKADLKGHEGYMKASHPQHSAIMREIASINKELIALES